MTGAGTRTYVVHLRSSADAADIRGDIEDVATGERVVVTSLAELAAVLTQPTSTQPRQEETP